jgi:Mannosyltransferase (PIG-V)
MVEDRTDDATPASRDGTHIDMSWSDRSDHPYLPYLWALSIFLCSRVVVALGLVFSHKYLTIYPEVWSAGPRWYHQLLQWDSEWYFRIVTEGYRYNGDPTIPQTIVFYPLYPMLARGLSAMSGLAASDSLLVVSNVAASLAVVFLFKLVREEFDDRLALATIALLSFFPTAVLLSAGYTESLELLLIVWFFLALKRKRFVSAALLAGLAVADRSTGIVLLPVLLWELWLNRDQKPFFPAVIPCVVLATSGLWLFMIYLWYYFGDPLVFSDAQVAYHLGTTLAARLTAALKFEPFTRMILNDWNPWGLDSWFTLLFIVLIFVGWFRLRRSWTFFAIGALLLPYLTLSGGPTGFVSMSRFNLISFPLFVVLASTALRTMWLLTGVVGLFSACLFMSTALFARRIWIG